MISIIGFTGKAKSGKDTCCELIKNEFPNANIIQLAFADPIKQACQVLFNLTDNQLHNQNSKELIDPRWSKTPRQLFQWLGTDVLRKQFDKYIFIKNMKNRIDTIIQNNKNKNTLILVSDIRFDNEATLIKSYFHLHSNRIIKISRNEAEEVDKTSLIWRFWNYLFKKKNHESENGIHEYLVDFKIKNDSTIEELKSKLFVLLPSFLN